MGIFNTQEEKDSPVLWSRRTTGVRGGFLERIAEVGVWRGEGWRQECPGRGRGVAQVQNAQTAESAA